MRWSVMPSECCLVAMTSNRGLCGPFNNNVIKLANQRLDRAA